MGYALLAFLGRHTTPSTKITLIFYHLASPILSAVRISLGELVITHVLIQ